MKRREFLQRSWLTGASLLTLPALSALGGGLIVGCDDDTESGGSGDGDVTYSVDSASGHVHSFTIPGDKLDNPPAGGFTASTSSSLGHVHSITLTQAELTDIADLMAVSKDTGLGDGHVHSFTFPNP